MSINQSFMTACLVAGTIGLSGCNDKKEEPDFVFYPEVPAAIKDAKPSITQAINTDTIKIKSTPSFITTQKACAQRINETIKKYKEFNIPVIAAYNGQAASYTEKSQKKVSYNILHDPLFSILAVQENSVDYCFFLAQKYVAGAYEYVDFREWFRTRLEEEKDDFNNFRFWSIIIIAFLGWCLYIYEKDEKEKNVKNTKRLHDICDKYNIPLKQEVASKWMAILDDIISIVQNPAKLKQATTDLAEAKKEIDSLASRLSIKETLSEKQALELSQKEKLIKEQRSIIKQYKESELIKAKMGVKVSAILESGTELISIIERLKKLQKWVDADDDFGHFTAYFMKEIEEHINTLRRTVLRLTAQYNNQSNAPYLVMISSLSEEAIAAYDSWDYRKAIQDCFGCLGVCNFIESLLNQASDTANLNTWLEFLKEYATFMHENGWLDDDGTTLYNFFDLFWLDVEMTWSETLVKKMEKQYKKKASQYHPDKNLNKPDQKEREKKFKLLPTAKEVFMSKDAFEMYIRAYTIFSL